MAARSKVLVLFYSCYGHVFQMAKAAAEGAREVTPAVDIMRVPETLPEDLLKKIGAFEAQKQFADIPIAQVGDLPKYDAILLGTPTRFGNMAGQMKTFLDGTGGIWATGGLVGKAGGVFTSTATQHGGQESTILSAQIVLQHHGMVVVGLPYSYSAQTVISEVVGGSPYGATTIAGSQGERNPNKIELDGAKFQGKHIATIASKLAAK